MQTQHEWESAVVRDVVLKTATWNPAKEPRDTIRYVDVSAVSRERSAIEEATDYPANQAPGRARKIIHTNDTIFATIRPSLRRIAQVPEQFDNELASTAFCVLRPNPKKIDHDFLFHAVSSEPFVEAVVNLETGASYPAVRDRDILDQSIPLPPIAEQKDIGSSLNLVRTALLHQSNSLTVAQELKRAAMRELFTKGLRGEPQKQTDIGLVPESWELVFLGDQTSVVSKGSSPKWQGFEYKTEGVLFVRSQNVGDGFMDFTDKAFLHPSWNEKEKRSVLKAGDVLINLVGASIGRAAVGQEEIENANCNQAVAFARLKPNTLLAKFVVGFLLTQEGQKQIHGQKKDIARANLSLEDVRNFVIPKPHPDEQREIAQILDAIDRKIDLHKRKKAVLEELFKSLLHKLMTGEIRVSDLDLTAIQTGGH